MVATESGLKFRRGREPTGEQLFYKILLYGDSGAGKTWMAVSAGPGALVLLTEANGEQSVRMSNPDARYSIVNDIAEVRNIIRMARSGDLTSEEDPVDVLVIDGLTEIQRLFRDEITAERGVDQPFTFDDWSDLTEKMRRFLRVIRDLPCHVICTALSESEMEGETRHIYPAFQGRKLFAEVMQYFHAVGYVYKQAETKSSDAKKGDELRHVAMFSGPSRIACKTSYPLRGTRQGPVSDWLAELANATPPPKPDPAAEKPEGDAKKTRGARAKKGDDQIP